MLSMGNCYSRQMAFPSCIMLCMLHVLWIYISPPFCFLVVALLDHKQGIDERLGKILLDLEGRKLKAIKKMRYLM